MKMNAWVLAFLVISLSQMTQPAEAQEAKKDKKEKKEIIIRVDEKGGKTVIEVEGDKVTVNGNEVTGADKEAIILKRSMPNGRIYMWQGDSLSFQSPLDHPKAMPDTRIFKDDGTWRQTESRAQLGIRLQDHEKGVEVMEVTEPSAAATAGIQVKDVITAVDGKKIVKATDMVDYIQSRKPGDKVELSILRDGKEMSVPATLREMKTVSEFRSFELPMGPGMRQSIDDLIRQGTGSVIIRDPVRRKPRMGILLEELETGKGLKVIQVTPGLPAEKAGIQKGDVILKVMDQPLTSIDDFADAIKDEPADCVLSLQRSGKMMEVKVKLAKPLRKMEF